MDRRYTQKERQGKKIDPIFEELQRRQELLGIQRLPFQETSHVGNLSVSNPLDGEFSYINENLVDFTYVNTKEEAREREVRADK